MKKITVGVALLGVALGMQTLQPRFAAAERPTSNLSDAVLLQMVNALTNNGTASEAEVARRSQAWVTFMITHRGAVGDGLILRSISPDVLQATEFAQVQQAGSGAFVCGTALAFEDVRPCVIACVICLRENRDSPAALVNCLRDYNICLAEAIQKLAQQCLGVPSSGPPLVPPGGGPAPCNTQTFAGGDQPETHTFDMGQTSGSFLFEFRSFTIKDRFIVSKNGVEIFNTGCLGTGGTKTATINFSGTGNIIKVVVQPNCEQDREGTAWDFTVNCPL